MEIKTTQPCLVRPQQNSTLVIHSCSIHLLSRCTVTPRKTACSFPHPTSCHIIFQGMSRALCSLGGRLGRCLNILLFSATIWNSKESQSCPGNIFSLIDILNTSQLFPPPLNGSIIARRNVGVSLFSPCLHKCVVLLM